MLKQLRCNELQERKEAAESTKETVTNPTSKGPKTHAQRALPWLRMRCQGTKEAGKTSADSVADESGQGCEESEDGQRTRPLHSGRVSPQKTASLHSGRTTRQHTNNWQACKHSHATKTHERTQHAQRRTTTRPLPRKTAVLQDMKGWLTSKPFRDRLGTTAEAAKSASTLQKVALATLEATSCTMLGAGN